jgi:hypothetical protein
MKSQPQTKLIVVGVVATAVTVWVLINLVPMLMPARDARALDTPGWRTVAELNEALLKERSFVDTSFIVETEEPLKLKVVGGVHSEEELADLREYLKEIRPQGDYEVEVEVMRPH